MGKGACQTNLTMCHPTGYSITVRGCLDASWSDRLGGLQITVSNTEQEGVVTRLSGELLDQAALMGVLNALYSLQFPLISVHLWEMDEDHCK